MRICYGVAGAAIIFRQISLGEKYKTNNRICAEMWMYAITSVKGKLVSHAYMSRCRQKQGLETGGKGLHKKKSHISFHLNEFLTWQVGIQVTFCLVLSAVHAVAQRT